MKDRKEKRAYEKKMQQIRGNRIGMIFQESDDISESNPENRNSDDRGNPKASGIYTKEEAEAKAIELMRQVGIPSPEKQLDQYPWIFQRYGRESSLRRLWRVTRDWYSQE